MGKDGRGAQLPACSNQVQRYLALGTRDTSYLVRIVITKHSGQLIKKGGFVRSDLCIAIESFYIQGKLDVDRQLPGRSRRPSRTKVLTHGLFRENRADWHEASLRRHHPYNPACQ